MKARIALACATISTLLFSAASTAADQKGEYPLTTCVVSGEPLGAMGKPVIVNYKGTEVRLCCKGCIKEFNKDPGKCLATLEAPAGNRDPSDHKGQSGHAGRGAH